MKRRFFLQSAVCGAAAAVGGFVFPKSAKAAPKAAGFENVTLKDALMMRKTTRDFAEKDLPKAQLLNLLWAAFGINRPGEGKRTAPSAWNRQEISVYAAMKDGLYLYDPEAEDLKKVLDKDIRKHTGEQGFVKKAPVNLVYVADISRMKGPKDERIAVAWADTGFIGQNVYLFCAAEGLATVVRAWIDYPVLHAAMGLKEDQEIVMSQTVGFPA